MLPESPATCQLWPLFTNYRESFQHHAKLADQFRDSGLVQNKAEFQTNSIFIFQLTASLYFSLFIAADLHIQPTIEGIQQRCSRS